MGYRSTFVTNESCVNISEKFYEKYKGSIHFNPCDRGEEDFTYTFPISSKSEGKMYGMYSELIADLQKLIKEERMYIDLIVLHEDGACDYYIIRKDNIKKQVLIKSSYHDD